jgi:hypothetical protein
MESDYVEKAVLYIAEIVAQEAYNVLPIICSFKRAEVSRVGDVDQRGTLQQVAALAEKFNATINSVIADKLDGDETAINSESVRELLASLKKFGSCHAP